MRQPRGGVVRGQRGRIGTAVGRAAISLVTLAAGSGLCMVLLAPPAGASPEGDADDAITAAWKAAGGDDSNLGAKQGDVYRVGEGFGQDFAHGKMFFTPATGAKSISGAVLDKYQALGGPAGSDLGFPTINEVPGLAGPDSRVSMFSASDKPVIFWTREHGAFVVRGAINAAWDKLGSSGGVLGVPVGDETYDGEVATQAFSGGRVSWNRLTKAFATVPPELAQQLTAVQIPIDPTAAINMAWRAAGGASGPLGAKQGGQYPVGGDGLGQNFAGGKVFFSPAAGANALESDVLTKYESLGGPVGSDLGFPTANEADGGIEPASRVATFSAADKPAIFWTSNHGAFVVRGAIRAAWDKLGGPKGKLGAPLGDQTTNKDVVAQKFAGGRIAWDQAKNTFSTEPANLASSLSGLQVPGQKMPARSAPTAGRGTGPTWHWWWLLIPLLLLIGMLVLLVPQWRRRRARGRVAAVLDRHDDGYEAVTESVSRWPRDADSDLATSRLSRGYVERSRRPPTLGPPGVPDSEWMSPATADLADEPQADEIASAPVLSDLDENADVDPDAVDTAPTRIPSEAELSTGRHVAAETADDEGGGDYFAPPQPRAPGQLAIHLPLDDPYQVPDGYPVKANASFGLYYMPDSALYDDTLAEIWFASEEIAQANGFTKAG
jgi:uncharacterized protein with LGFP repeats